MKNQVERLSTGTHWEEIGRYRRAVRVGNLILGSGTTVTEEEPKAKFANDPTGQAKASLNNPYSSLKLTA